MFQKSLCRKARYKNHVPIKYCITKIVQNVCTCASSFPHSCTHTETCFNTFKRFSTRITVRNKAELLFILGKATFGTHCTSPRSQKPTCPVVECCSSTETRSSCRCVFRGYDTRPERPKICPRKLEINFIVWNEKYKQRYIPQRC
jgi:hypothetical protein